jgi:hypothetical protein
MDLAVHEVADYPAVRNLVASRFSEKVARKNEQYPVFRSRGLAHLIACLGAGRKIHRHIMRPKLFATTVAISLPTLLLIWLLLIAVTRKEAEPPRQLIDYSAPSGSG